MHLGPKVTRPPGIVFPLLPQLLGCHPHRRGFATGPVFRIKLRKAFLDKSGNGFQPLTAMKIFMTFLVKFNQQISGMSIQLVIGHVQRYE